MHSEIQNQLSGLLTNVLFLPQYKLQNVRLLTHVEEHMFFQNNMCTEATLGEFAISLGEPVKVESESRNFSEEQRVYRWQ